MANYISLSKQISLNRGNLTDKLIGLSIPSDTDKVKLTCVEFINNITCQDSEYMNQLSLLEQDLINPVLKVIDTIYSSDIKLNQKVNFTPKEESSVTNFELQKTFTKSTSKEYAPALVGSAAGTILATVCKPQAWGVILLGSVVSAIIGKVLYSLYFDKDKNLIVEVGDSKPTKFEHKLNASDVDIIINALVNACDCIDNVLLTYRKHLEILQNDFKKKEQSFELDKKYISVLECYQSLLGNLADMDDSAVVSDSVRKITQSLKKHGYKAVNYDPTQDMLNIFNVKEEDVESIEQFCPAILKCSSSDDMLVLKGEVVIPKK